MRVDIPYHMMFKRIDEENHFSLNYGNEYYVKIIDNHNWLFFHSYRLHCLCGPAEHMHFNWGDRHQFALFHHFGCLPFKSWIEYIEKILS